MQITGLALEHSQKQQLSPALQQSLQVLQLGHAELATLLAEELQSNPALETEDETDPDDDPFIASNMGSMKGYESMNEIAVSGVSLREQLLQQLLVLELSAREKKAAFVILGNLDERGYLMLDDEAIAKASGLDVSEIENLRGDFMSLEPHGCGARSLEECLLFQARLHFEEESLEVRILRDRGALLAETRFTEISKLERVSVKQIASAVQALRILSPYPGQSFETDRNSDMIPEVIVRYQNGEYIPFVNTFGTPTLRLNKSFTESASNNSYKSPESKYVRSQLRSGSWLLRCVQQRNHTLLRIARCIIELEYEFLERGIEHLKPLHLADIAASVGLHESTVSRAISHKYIQTPRGTFEFKYFFGARLKKRSADVSSKLVKEAIRNMIAREDHSNPLSDYALADLLKQSAVKIARRTVTKYREQLRIPSASIRREYAAALG